MHAPLPYSVEGEGQETIGILSIDNHYVAFLKGREKTSQDDTANFIVRACNSHYELVAALETLVKWGAAAGIGNSARSKQWTMFESARSALAKAKGE